MNMLFRKKQKAPFEQMIEDMQAMEARLYTYIHDYNYVPGEEEMRCLRQLQALLHHLHCIAVYCETCFERRRQEKANL